MNDNLFDICLSSFYNKNDIDYKTSTQRLHNELTLKEPKEDETGVVGGVTVRSVVGKY